MIKKLLLSICLIILGQLLFLNNGVAADFPLEIAPQYPSNQIDTSKGYFQLLIQQNKKQNLIVKIKNTSSQKKEFRLSITNAITNQNGIIDYIKKADPLTPIKFSDIAKAPSKLALEPNEEKEILVNIQMPNIKNEGIILGALKFEEMNSKKRNEQLIQNKINYILGVSLQEKLHVEKENITLHSVHLAQANYKTVFHAKLKNSIAALTGKFSIDAKIYKIGGKRALYTNKQQELYMAPSSSFNFSIPTNGQRIDPGKYKLIMKINDKDNTMIQTKEFSISSKVAKKNNDQSIEYTDKFPVFHLVLLISAGFLILVLIYYIYRLKRKK
ncbi:DUF916 and DUF3324 domain-containing protein [Listeria valentina]|uniref:DUF916 and DUF3324 domain-containing protein n=1 Tax=Listeria valentina TaxID=2705293 RepID=UPI001430BB84|nr:DUF916 and DUF3324 domain-containing protein [Listeria valentina]